MGEIAYRIDAEDRIVWCSPAYDEFAAANDGRDCCAARVHERLIWDFIGDPPTREIYRDVFRRVRAGRRMRLPFRCDAPHIRRWMELEMVAGSAGGIDFQVSSIREEDRLHEALLHVSATRDDRALTICGWCKRMVVDEEWVEIEKGVDRLGLFGYPSLPELTHGICPDCMREMVGAIEGKG